MRACVLCVWTAGTLCIHNWERFPLRLMCKLLRQCVHVRAGETLLICTAVLSPAALQIYGLFIRAAVSL